MNYENKNLDIEELVALDTAHHFHPFTDQKALDAEGGTRIITHAEGVYLWDAQGRKVIDGMAGLWCVNIGYGHKSLAEAAYNQMLELPYYNTFFKTATVPVIELADKVASLLPDRFNKVFFVNSGSEANDTIVRLVRHYWELKGEPERNVFIARENAYHGSTMASASLGGMAFMHAQGGLPIAGIEHVAQPYWYGEGGDMSPDEFGLKTARAVEEKILELGPEKVAAFIGEPVQGAGGVIVPPDTYWPEINRICEKYGVLLIADEVICGFGRTGNWFGWETFGIEPDIIPMAKGLSSGYAPIGAVAVADKVADVVYEAGSEFAHGFTYSGHPVACAVALENIRILENEGLVERVAAIAPYFEERLATLNDHPLVGEIRIVGLLGAVELSRDKANRAFFEEIGRVGAICRDHCVANDLIVRACRDTMVMSPPFVITESEIDQLVQRLRLALDTTLAEVKSEMAQ
ncbi:MAG: aspartate aminotransferase family protein [Hyphomicrobiales bacterium]